MTTTLEHPHEFLRSGVAAASNRMASALEAVAVLASPAVLYAVLRVRGMAPPQLPDPSMHTTFIVAPQDIFARYQALFTPSARLREGARVGFLVPARLAYQLFGAVPGFFAFRYLLALVAVVPLYLLLRKLYGRWAGFVGIAVVLSSPVFITALGTDYPDSAAVSYLTGGLAALALSCEGQHSRAWLAASGGLLTMAVWSHGASVPLVATLIVVYLGVRLRRDRALLGRDTALLAASAILITGLLAIGSKLLLGQFNFITTTVKSAIVLSRSSELRFNHSESWSWAPYDAYLLVPPAIVASYFAVFARRWRTIGTTQLFVGLTGALQLALFASLQFLGSFQALEMHYFSSTLWSSVNIMLAMTVVEVARPIAGLRGAQRSQDSAPERRAARTVQLGRWTAGAVPALLVLAVALAYEAADKINLHVPAMTWARWGAAVAAIIVAAALIGRLTNRRTASTGHQREGARLVPGRIVSASAVVVMTGAVLVLTVAPTMPHGPLPNTVYDPPSAYSKALGGNDTAYVAEYAATSRLPAFVGPPAYQGEPLLTWEPQRQFGDLQGPMGLYHNAITWVSTTFPLLSPNGARKIEAWHAAQVLLMSLTGQDFAKAVRSLARFHPVVVRRRILSDGWYHLHVWLVDLEGYLHRRQARG